MTYTEVGFSLKSGFKKIVLTQKLVLVLNRDSQKYCLHQFFLNKSYQKSGWKKWAKIVSGNGEWKKTIKKESGSSGLTKVSKKWVNKVSEKISQKSCISKSSFSAKFALLSEKSVSVWSVQFGGQRFIFSVKCAV